MKRSLFSVFAFVALSSSSYIPDGLLQEIRAVVRSNKRSDTECGNTPNSRERWGEYSVDTNYITTFPDTGRTVEVWLSAEEAICNPDGFERTCMTFNGTMPGPPIVANWGDNLIIHVTNNLKTNGTTVHWHGVRQLNTVEQDGVPGVTQCPIPPGGSMTYKFKVTQYGTSWYHSHISLQYSEGLFGPLIFHGPASANYDEDLGVLFLQDWSHERMFTAWHNKQKYGITHSLNNILINGTNTFNCSASESEQCIGGGKKFETVFQAGKKYLLRLVNVATDSQFQFSIDGHKLKVIANDFVPIKPYVTDSVILNGAQRYDVVVEANADPGDYWLRAFWVNKCAGTANDHPEDSTGIVRYDATSTDDPTTVSIVDPPTICSDEPLKNLEPHLNVDVSNIGGITLEELRVRFTHEALFTWTINSSTLQLEWSNPTLERVYNNDTSFPTELNVVSVDVSSHHPPNAGHLLNELQKRTSFEDEWAVLVIENKVLGLLAGWVFSPLNPPSYQHTLTRSLHTASHTLYIYMATTFGSSHRRAPPGTEPPTDSKQRTHRGVTRQFYLPTGTSRSLSASITLEHGSYTVTLPGMQAKAYPCSSSSAGNQSISSLQR